MLPICAVLQAQGGEKIYTLGGAESRSSVLACCKQSRELVADVGVLKVDRNRLDTALRCPKSGAAAGARAFTRCCLLVLLVLLARRHAACVAHAPRETQANLSTRCHTARPGTQ